MSLIRSEMPTLVRHEGDWEGDYQHVDAEGRELDRHHSRVSCRFPTEGPLAYDQLNIYTWADGKREEHRFPATYRDRAIWWDTERITGHAWQIDDRCIMLTWTRKDLAGSFLYEMIQISADNKSRARTWHWFVDDVLVKRTLVKEHRV